MHVSSVSMAMEIGRKRQIDAVKLDFLHSKICAIFFLTNTLWRLQLSHPCQQNSCPFRCRPLVSLTSTWWVDYSFGTRKGPGNPR